MTMKLHMTFSILGIILLGWFTAGAGNADEITRTVKVHKAYKVNSDCNLEISNKYGNVHIIPWTKDSVVIDIIFTARGSSEDKVNKILNYVDFDFTHTKYYVVARTYFKDYANSLWTDISNMAGALFSGGNSVEINYAVYMPVKAHLKVDNKFGNIFTTNHEGSLNIDLSNGDFKANNLNGDNRINITFGNGNIQKISKGTIEINYSEFFDIKEAGDLIIRSKSSKVSIEQVGSLNLVSRRDKYTISSIDELTGDCSFSYLNIYEMKQQVTVDTKYGSTAVQGISKDFSYIGIKSAYSDISLYIDNNQAYRFELIHDKKTTLALPTAYKDFKKELINKDDEIFQVTGSLGSNPSGRIHIDTKSGSVTVIQK